MSQQFSGFLRVFLLCPIFCLELIFEHVYMPTILVLFLTLYNTTSKIVYHLLNPSFAWYFEYTDWHNRLQTTFVAAGLLFLHTWRLLHCQFFKIYLQIVYDVLKCRLTKRFKAFWVEYMIRALQQDCINTTAFKWYFFPQVFYMSQSLIFVAQTRKAKQICTMVVQTPERPSSLD